MTLIKNFVEYLFEGKYDGLTGKICSEIIKKIKETNTGEEHFDGIKVIYKDTDDVPSFLEMIEENQYFLIGNFIDDSSGLDVTVYLTIIRDQFPKYKGGFILDGETDDQNSIIYTYISLDPKSEPKSYLEISFDLRNLIRHEIEHLTQRGYGEKPGKRIRRNEATRSRIRNNPELWYRYYLLKDEIPASLQGLYSEAKSRKIPFKDVVNDYLDKKVESGIISSDEKRRIYSAWKNAIDKIGGLPAI